MAAVSDEESPLLDELMPWSVPPPVTGRHWPLAADEGTLRARWAAFTGARGSAERERLLEPSRARALRSALPQLPGQPTGTGRLLREAGPCPEPVRVAYGAFDERLLLPDHRLLDAPRPELWRVADAAQSFLVEPGRLTAEDFPVLTVSGRLPFGVPRPARIRPLYRRPGGAEPNLAPGLLAHLADRYGAEVTPEDVADWALAAARPVRGGCAVPLPADGAVWARGVGTGRSLRAALVRGAGALARPRLPGGRRPYVRGALALTPRGPLPQLSYDARGEALRIGAGGLIAPVAAAAWEFRRGGEDVLARWFTDRLTDPGAEGLGALGPAAWPQQWTSELLELLTVLTLVAGAREEVRALTAGPGGRVGRAELRAARVLPVPPAARRPASVLDRQEEGAEGQFPLW